MIEWNRVEWNGIESEDRDGVIDRRALGAVRCGVVLCEKRRKIIEQVFTAGELLLCTYATRERENALVVEKQARVVQAGIAGSCFVV